MKFLAEDNDSFNDKKHILALGRDSPITAYCGGEFGINAQYPPPQTEPVARVKTANSEYKGYSARLNRWNPKDSDSKDMQVFKCRFLSNSTKEGGVYAKTLSNYSLLMCGFLLSDFRYQLKYSLNTGLGYDPGTCGLWVHLSYLNRRLK